MNRYLLFLAVVLLPLFTSAQVKFDPEKASKFKRGFYTQTVEGQETFHLFDSLGNLICSSPLDFMDRFGKHPYAIMYSRGDSVGIYSADSSVLLPLSILVNDRVVYPDDGPNYHTPPPYYAVIRDGLYGLVDSLNRVVIEFSDDFLMYTPFGSDYQIDKYRLVRKIGEECVMYDYQLKEIQRVRAEEFVDYGYTGYTLIKDGKLVEFSKDYQLLDVKPQKLTYTTPIMSLNQKYGLVDTNMNVLVPFRYYYISGASGNKPPSYFVFSSGYYSSGIMDGEGNIIVPESALLISQPTDEIPGLFMVKKSKDEALWALAFLNKKNELVVKTDYIITESYAWFDVDYGYAQAKISEDEEFRIYKNGKIKRYTNKKKK